MNNNMIYTYSIFCREITFENAEELTEEGLPFLILFHASNDTESIKSYKFIVESQLISEKRKTPHIPYFIRIPYHLVFSFRRKYKFLDGRWQAICSSITPLRKIPSRPTIDCNRFFQTYVFVQGVQGHLR